MKKDEGNGRSDREREWGGMACIGMARSINWVRYFSIKYKNKLTKIFTFKYKYGKIYNIY